MRVPVIVTLLLSLLLSSTHGNTNLTLNLRFHTSETLDNSTFMEITKYNYNTDAASRWESVLYIVGGFFSTPNRTYSYQINTTKDECLLWYTRTGSSNTAIDWIEITLDGNYITFGRQKLNFVRAQIYFCNDLFVDDDTTTSTATTATTAAPYTSSSHNLTVYIDYDAVIVLRNVTGVVGFSDDFNLNDINTMYSNTLMMTTNKNDDDFSTSNTLTFDVTNGCYELIFTAIETGISTEYHGNCIVYLNNTIAGYSGVYDRSDSVVICTWEHISRCITPGICGTSNSGLYVRQSVYEEWQMNFPGASAYSYKALANGRWCRGDIHLCLGTMSCYNALIRMGDATTLFCEAPYSCSYFDSNEANEYTYCHAPHSCQNFIGDSQIYGLVLSGVNSIGKETYLAIRDESTKSVDVYLDNSLSLLQGKINFANPKRQEWNTNVNFYVNSYFGFFNATIGCEYSDTVRNTGAINVLLSRGL